VILPPRADLFRFGQIGERFGVEHLIAEPAVEALGIAI
jgi:hypothetical protein